MSGLLEWWNPSKKHGILQHGSIQAGSMHPTGMLSCLLNKSLFDQSGSPHSLCTWRMHDPRSISEYSRYRSTDEPSQNSHHSTWRLHCSWEPDQRSQPDVQISLLKQSGNDTCYTTGTSLSLRTLQCKSHHSQSSSRSHTNQLHYRYIFKPSHITVQESSQSV